MTLNDLQTLTQRVCTIAIECGGFLREEQRNFSRDCVEEKGLGNYVSYVDKEAEQRLVTALHEVLPDAGFIAEERGWQEASTSPYTWIIDPLDGTTNYVHGMSPYAISIGLANVTEMLIGVVYEVGNDELFYACKNGGAWWNHGANREEGNKFIDPTPFTQATQPDSPTSLMVALNEYGDYPIQVSTVADPASAFVGMGLPYNAAQYNAVATELLHQLYGSVGGVRILGSAAAELCYLAAGRMDGRIENSLGPWDIAAGSVILREAGGRITDYSGRNLFYNAEEVVASNGPMHDYLLSLIARSLAK